MDNDVELKKKLATLRVVEGAELDFDEVTRTRPSHVRRKELVLEYLKPLVSGKSFLDIGSAHGLYSAFVAEHGATKVVGVEISTAQNKKARKACSRCTFIEHDAHDLSVVEGAYDIVFSSETIQHMYSYIDGVKEMVSKMKDDGLLIIVTLNISKSGVTEHATIDGSMTVEELRGEVGCGGVGKQNAVWKFNTDTLVKEIQKVCSITLAERIPIDTPDGKIKELWSILRFKK